MHIEHYKHVTNTCAKCRIRAIFLNFLSTLFKSTFYQLINFLSTCLSTFYQFFESKIINYCFIILNSLTSFFNPWSIFLGQVFFHFLINSLSTFYQPLKTFSMTNPKRLRTSICRLR